VSVCECARVAAGRCAKQEGKGGGREGARERALEARSVPAGSGALLACAWLGLAWRGGGVCSVCACARGGTPASARGPL
jgi:hypothetical protein